MRTPAMALFCVSGRGRRLQLRKLSLAVAAVCWCMLLLVFDQGFSVPMDKSSGHALINHRSEIEFSH